jgi:hypothetical protein
VLLVSLASLCQNAARAIQVDPRGGLDHVAPVILVHHPHDPAGDLEVDSTEVMTAHRGVHVATMTGYLVARVVMTTVRRVAVLIAVMIVVHVVRVVMMTVHRVAVLIAVMIVVRVVRVVMMTVHRVAVSIEIMIAARIAKIIALRHNAVLQRSTSAPGVDKLAVGCRTRQSVHVRTGLTKVLHAQHAVLRECVQKQLDVRKKVDAKKYVPLML